MPEMCQNPFKKKKCNSGEPIVTYITGNKIPICKKCWEEIADSDFQWDE